MKEAGLQQTPVEAHPPATLLELMGVLARRPVLLATSVIVGGLLGFGAAVSMRPAYEAVGLLQVGRVMQPTDAPSSARPESRAILELKPVEPPLQVVARIKSAGFIEASKLGSAPTVELLQRLKVKIVEGTELLQLRYTASTREAAREGLERLVGSLRSRHDQLAQQTRSALAGQLKVVEQARAASGEHRGELAQSLLRGSRTAAEGALPFLQLALAREDADLIPWEVGLRAALSPSADRPTQLVEPLFVTRNSITPGRVLVTVGGLLAGLLFGVAATLSRYVHERRRSR